MNQHRPSHFFKIILPSSIRDEKLGIPKKFVRMIGHDLSTRASLCVPNGDLWQVGLEKCNDQIWFSDGWNEFIEFYSISYGYFLVFKYDGNSSFHVLIFDTSASEIHYPEKHGFKCDDTKPDDAVIQISNSSVIELNDNGDGDVESVKVVLDSVVFISPRQKSSSSTETPTTRQPPTPPLPPPPPRKN